MDKQKTQPTVPGMPWIKVVDKDHVAAKVDGDWEVFARTDRYGGHPLSGLASFGPVLGDHRMIAAIASDIEVAFTII